MKTFLASVAMSLVLGFAGASYAEDKPDCSAQQTAADDAKKAVKDMAKPDVSSCADKKGKEKAECVKPIKDKHKEDMKAAKDKVAEAAKALKCCKNPKAKGCS